MGCCESNYRKSHDYLFGRSTEKAAFSFKDVVPIKYHHYLKEYEFEKNLPSVKERTSKILLKKVMLVFRNMLAQELSIGKEICLQEHKLLQSCI